MYKLTSKVNSPYDIEGQVLPSFGAINVPELTDYTRLLRDLDVVEIEEAEAEVEDVQIEPTRRGRPAKTNKE